MILTLLSGGEIWYSCPKPEIPAAAEACLNGGADNFPYVAATNRELAAAMVDWLAN